MYFLFRILFYVLFRRCPSLLDRVRLNRENDVVSHECFCLIADKEEGEESSGCEDHNSLQAVKHQSM